MKQPTAILATLLLVGCNYTDTTLELSPEVAIEGHTSLTAGSSATLSATVISSRHYSLAWSIDGVPSGDADIITIHRDTVCTVAVMLSAENCYGTTTKQVKVKFRAATPPSVKLAEPEIFTASGDSTHLYAGISKADSICWTVNGTPVGGNSARLDLLLGTGTHTVVVTAFNDDGSNSDSCHITVCSPDDIPCEPILPHDTYSITAGATLAIWPTLWNTSTQAQYVWQDGETLLQSSDTPKLDFSSDRTGTHILRLTATNLHGSTQRLVTVKVCSNNIVARTSATPSPRATTVFGYTPAAGQFVDEQSNITSADKATEYARQRLESGLYVSLGAYGGRIVVGFDHSITNDTGYNLRITGNAFAESSEPGTVWVMQDTDGNGLPDDTWYELQGSESGVSGYAVRYYRSSGNVQWRDNRGGCGVVTRNEFHTQNSYYPQWLESEVTFCGTLLKADLQEIQPGYYVSRPLGWGYADNYGSDRDDVGVLLKISNAVCADGSAANLSHIDFVMIQCAVNASAPNIGELSTEVCAIEDYNLCK